MARRGNMTEARQTRGASAAMNGGAMLAARARLVHGRTPARRQARGRGDGTAAARSSARSSAVLWARPSARSPASRRGWSGCSSKARSRRRTRRSRTLYGVDISDKAVLQQIVDTAKQSYGGNLDMAIRTQHVRDLIQLYAMSTGQATKGMPATVHPLDLVQSGGSLYQSPGYSNGTALPGMGGLPTLDSHRRRRGLRRGAGGHPTRRARDHEPPAGRGGEAIASNPRVVAGASLSAAKSNAGRRELTSLQLSPGLVTS